MFRHAFQKRKRTDLKILTLFIAILVTFVPMMTNLPNRAEASTASPTTEAAGTTLKVYPAPQGVGLNTQFTVKVRVPGGEWQDLDEYDTTVGAARPSHASFVYFDTDGPVEVSVTDNIESVTSAAIRPLSNNIIPAIDGNTMTFIIDGPKKLSFEVNGDVNHNLMIFANPIETNPPSPTDPNVIYLGPGLYKQHYTVPSGKTLYLAGGAVIQGGINLDNATNAKVLGRGVLDHPPVRAISADYANQITIDGIIVNDYGYGDNGGCAINLGNSSNVTINNFKAFSYQKWTDGIDTFSAYNIKINDYFGRTGDDSIAIYTARQNGGKIWSGDSSRISMTNSILMPDLARPINIGTHGYPNAPGGGYTISDISFSNLDILLHNAQDTGRTSPIQFAVGDGNLVQNVKFTDIRIEDNSVGKIVQVATQNTVLGAGRGLHNVYFKNVSYTGSNQNASIINGYNSSRITENITFENLTVNGNLILDAASGNFSINGYTKNIRFVGPGASVDTPADYPEPTPINLAWNRDVTEDDSQSGSPAWKVDLGATMNITGGAQVTWENGGDYAYKIETSNDGSHWTLKSAKTDLENADPYQNDFFLAAARYIRVTLTDSASGSEASIRDLKIFGNPSNLALSKSASADSAQSTYPASNATDGNGMTSWRASDSNGAHQLQVDLGSNRNITYGTQVWWEKGSESYPYKIETSTDGTNWSEKVDKTQNTNTEQIQTDYFTGTARYVRLTVTGLPSGTNTGIYEFQVFGTPVDLALNKIAFADSSQAAYPATNGNDGNATTRWTAKDEGTDHWFELDFGKNVNITEGSQVMWESSDTAYQYRIDTSTDGINWTLKIDKLGNTDNAQVQSDFFTGTARYIRIAVTGLPSGAKASLYDFKVFGDPGSQALDENIYYLNYFNSHTLAPDGYTKGSYFLYRQEIDRIKEAVAKPDADKTALLNEYAQAEALLVPILSIYPKISLTAPMALASSGSLDGKSDAAKNGWFAFDGDPSTFPDTKTSAGWTRIDLGEGHTKVLGGIRFLPRVDNFARMEGALIQGSNDGAEYDTLLTINNVTSGKWDTRSIHSSQTYRYFRFYSPNGYSNVSELEFYEGIVDRTLLGVLLDQANGADPGGYTEEDFANLQTEASNAQVVYAKASVTQNDVDSAAFRLMQALKGTVPLTAGEVARSITTIRAPKKGETDLILPVVPPGYAIVIKSSDSNVISSDGKITIPSGDTTVRLVLSVTRSADGTSADTAGLSVMIPGESEWSIAKKIDGEAMTKVGKWALYKTSAAYNSSETYIGDSSHPITDDTQISYSFTGSKVRVIAKVDSSQVGANVYIDNQLVQFMNTKATDKTYNSYDILWTSDDLSLGLHTIKLVPTGKFGIDYIEFVPMTAKAVASSITSIATPVKGETRLTLPVVPSGYTIAIKSSDNGAIATDGTIVSPLENTTVHLTFTITKSEDNTTADTASLSVTVPGTSDWASAARVDGEEMTKIGKWALYKTSSAYNSSETYIGDSSHPIAEGDQISYSFTGGNVRVIAKVDSSQVGAKVYIDDQFVQALVTKATVSSYNGYDIVWTSENVAPGQHTIKLVPTGKFGIDYIEYIPLSAKVVANSITSIPAPAKGATSLPFPAVPSGYTIAIKSSDSNVIAADGTIVPPLETTTVHLVFTITKSDDLTTADTVGLAVSVPGKTTGTVPTLSGPSTVLSGQSLDLTYGIESVTESVYANEFTVNYDPNQLKLNAANVLIDGFSIKEETEQQPGQSTIVISGVESDHSFTGSASLLQLHFEALTTAVSVTSSVYLSNVKIADELGNKAALKDSTPYLVQILPLDRSVLENEIQMAQALSEWKYTSSSWAALQAALETAIVVSNNPAATQEEVDAVIIQLQESVTALQALIDQTALLSKIAEAATMTSSASIGMLWGQYPQSTVDALKEAIAHANTIGGLSGASQEQVDQAVSALVAAIQSFQASLRTKASIQDLDVMSAHYGMTFSDERWSTVQRYDLNHDQTVGIVDLSAIAKMILHD